MNDIIDEILGFPRMSKKTIKCNVCGEETDTYFVYTLYKVSPKEDGLSELIDDNAMKLKLCEQCADSIDRAAIELRIRKMNERDSKLFKKRAGESE